MRQEARDEEEELERKRSFLLVLATLAATVTYDAGLSPPGGFWSHDKGPDYLAGDPVLRNHYPRRFKAFLVCNATAFAGSLVIIIMLLSDTAVDHVSQMLCNCVYWRASLALWGPMLLVAAGTSVQLSLSSPLLVRFCCTLSFSGLNLL
jgi:hypothetical protein